MRCPEDEQLKSFLVGRLPEEFSHLVEKHLLSCFSCQSRLPLLDHESISFLTSIEFKNSSDFEYLDEPECSQLLEFGKKLADRKQTSQQHTTIVVDRLDIDTGIPKSIGRYQVIRHLGAGSFGTVYLAKDVQLDRQVAIKVAHPTRIKSPEDAERYQREAKLLARMEHTNIVPVYDSGLTEEGLVFIVFRFIRGSDLAAMIQPERFPLESAVQLTSTIASALHYMHTHGIVHRDIKPANILIDQEGVPYLTDFGLAIRADDIVNGREIVGTLAYMSPEQIRGDGHLVGPRSDVFSLGVLLFELLTGQRPFQNRKPDNAMTWIVEAPSPCDIEKTIPLSIGRICQKALQTRSADRFSSAREFARELQQCLDDSHQRTEPGEEKPVYRGLRAFHRDDQRFFCDLLPGLRSSQGNPESVQFWVNRIQGVEGELQPRIGVIYGTSGSGKSSLVSAGILPKLSDEITVISVQASASRTEFDLANALKRVFLGSEEIDSLPEICRHIRMREPPFANRRVLIVIDQFEQWLHGRSIHLNVDLIQALRQCDGESIQCLTIVRDDFWVELSTFMRTVEEPMREGENMMAVEPFTLEHAESVLQKIGQVVKGEPVDKETRCTFIQRGVQLIQSEGSVPPVRLALFVEITKDLPWEAETIRHFKDLNILGHTYIKQRFDPDLCPRRFRPHTTAMKAILAALLPERGNDLKGQGQTLEELQVVSGYQKSPERFRQLIDLMDRDLRILSPIQQNEDDGTDSLKYQLTHDYLVPAIRSWLDEEEIRTYQGRANLKLQERVSMWSLKKESRQLPGVVEVLQIFTGTRISQWTSEQSQLMKAATRRIALWACTLTALLFTLSSVLYIRANANNDAALLNQLAKSTYDNVPDVLDKLEEKLPRIQTRVLETYESIPENSKQRTRLELAILNFKPSIAEALKEKLLEADVHEFRLIANELLEHQVSCKEFLSRLSQIETPMRTRFRAAAMLLASEEHNELLQQKIADELVNGLVSQSQFTVFEWTEWLHPYRSKIKQQLINAFHNQKSPTASENASRILSRYLLNDSDSYTDLILKAEDRQLYILCDAIREQGRELTAKAEQQLLSRLDTISSDDLDLKVNALVALVHLEKVEHILHYLGRNTNPTLRYRLIHKLASSDCDPRLLFNTLREVEDSASTAAILLALGSLELSNSSDVLIEEMRSLSRSLYQDHPNAEVHAAAEWALKQLGDPIPELPPQQTENQSANWRISPAGHTMITADIGHLNLDQEQLRSYAESLSDLSVEWDFSISAHEVTVEQFLQFDPQYSYNPALHPTKNCAVSKVNIETAMKFCNWLSKEEGMKEEDLCYEPDGRRTRLKANFLKRKGYRLPLEVEWEIATRAGSVTIYPFGSSTQQISQFAWHAEISHSQAHPVGSLKPNQFGLFDVCGNVSEWCHGMSVLTQNASKRTSKSETPFRGGSFQSFSTSNAPFGSMQSGHSLDMAPDARLPYQGFRIARTIALKE